MKRLTCRDMFQRVYRANLVVKISSSGRHARLFGFQGALLRGLILLVARSQAKIGQYWFRVLGFQFPSP